MRDPLDVSDPVQRRKAIGIVVMFFAALGVMLLIRPSWINAVVIVLSLTLVIMLHEAGHFWTAKKAGMKVTEFFVGFGPRIWSFRKGETEYGIKALPLGGYVRIIGMNNVEEVPPEDEARTYRASTTPKKLMVILAGVTVNFILAFVCIATLFAVRGEPRVDASTPRVGSIAKDAPAANSGLKVDDELVAINGTQITNFEQVPTIVQASNGEPLTIVVRRDGVEQTATVAAKAGDDGKYRIGIGQGGTLVYDRFAPHEAMGTAIVWMGDTTVQVVGGIGKLFTPSFITSYFNTVKAGDAESVERPRTVVGIGRETSVAMDRDPWSLLYMLAILNLFLAIFNLIPLLPFDGGHAVIAVYEAAASRVRRRKVVVDYNKLVPLATGVFVILVLLAVPALVLDISQFFG